jgi:invasion protein IalB
MNAGAEQRGCGVMGRYAAVAIACGFALALSGQALAQAGGNASRGGSVAKPAGPAKVQGEPAKPEVAVAGNFGQWALVCGKDGKDPCSLVQALVQRETQKLVFRLTLAYGPKGNLVLRVDGPTGVAFRRGSNSRPTRSRSTGCPIRPAFRLVVLDDLKQELTKSQKGTITVYALNGQALQAVAELTGFFDGLAALDKRRPKQ